MSEKINNGTRKEIDGKACVYYDGYWIRYYAPPEESLAERKQLIDSLTRRLFHHTEHGINTPGDRLNLAREAFDRETDPARKRVNGAMLAGALFNRAADIFTTVVELADRGVEISHDNDLMRECGEYFREALELGKTVRHYSGHEGIDELWGEPLKAFTMTMEDFYESRYVKVAQTMRDIDRIAVRLEMVFADDPAFQGLTALIREFAEAARLESETMRSDPVIFEVWPRFVAAGEALLDFEPEFEDPSPHQRHLLGRGRRLIIAGYELITYLAGARVPMPKSTAEFLERCDAYAREKAAQPLSRRRRGRAAG